MGLIPNTTRGIIVFMILFSIVSMPFISSTMYDNVIGTQKEMVAAINGTSYTPEDIGFDIPLFGYVQIPIIGRVLSGIMNFITIIGDIFIIVCSYVASILMLPSILPIVVAVPLVIILLLGFMLSLVRLVWGND